MKTYLRHHFGMAVLCFVAPLLCLFLPKLVVRHVSSPWSEAFVVMAVAIGIGIASVVGGSRLDAWRKRKTK